MQCRSANGCGPEESSPTAGARKAGPRLPQGPCPREAESELPPECPPGTPPGPCLAGRTLRAAAPPAGRGLRETRRPGMLRRPLSPCPAPRPPVSRSTPVPGRSPGFAKPPPRGHSHPPRTRAPGGVPVSRSRAIDGRSPPRTTPDPACRSLSLVRRGRRTCYAPAPRTTPEPAGRSLSVVRRGRRTYYAPRAALYDTRTRVSISVRGPAGAPDLLCAPSRLVRHARAGELPVCVRVGPESGGGPRR